MSVPKSIGRYLVRRRLGAGAFATVWLAYDEQLDSPVAIKVLADNWAADDHVRRRFLEEGRFLRRVESPHVVAVYDAGELEDGRPYLVMTYADGGTLADRLAGDQPPVSRADTARIITQVAAGLDTLHRHAVLHRDVKPANVLFRTGPEGMRAMVGDLGLGKALDATSKLTMIGGTPAFVAPEQAMGERLDPRTDQYSLAAVAYRLLAGRPPYPYVAIGDTIAKEPPPEVAGLSPAAQAVIARALSRGRTERWPDILGFATALDAELTADSGNGIGSTTSEAPPGAAFELGERTALASRAPATLNQSSGQSPGHSSGPAMETLAPDRRGVSAPAVLLAALLALGGGGVAGYTWPDSEPAMKTLIDDSGTLEVTVPETWLTQVAESTWAPAESRGTFPALAAGSGPGWRENGSEESGVFLTTVPIEDVDSDLPGHPACQEVSTERSDGDTPADSYTEISRRCPGVIVEHVKTLTKDRVLWVQVRADDVRTARRVLDSVSGSS
ncbi:MAG: serine/threonine-protein kinase [Nocardioides sp.]